MQMRVASFPLLMWNTINNTYFRLTEGDDMIAQPGPCNIEIRDASMSQEEFLKR